MADYLKSFQDLQTKQAALKQSIVQFQVMKDFNEKKKAELETAIKAKGFDPANLDTEIANLEAKIKKDLANITEQLNVVNQVVTEIQNF